MWLSKVYENFINENLLIPLSGRQGDTGHGISILYVSSCWQQLYIRLETTGLHNCTLSPAHVSLDASYSSIIDSDQLEMSSNSIYKYFQSSADSPVHGLRTGPDNLLLFVICTQFLHFINDITCIRTTRNGVYSESIIFDTKYKQNRQNFRD